MELYILDDQYRRIKVVDKFESLVWTERFQEYGDFVLTMYSTRESRLLFSYGTKLIVNKSNRIMIVDEIENKSDSEGRKILSVKGSSIEKVLDDRVASNALSNTTSFSKGTVTVDIANSTVTSASHKLITGDEIYFSSTGVLTRIKSRAASVVSITNNTIKIKKHGLSTEDPVYFTGTVPSPLVVNTTYYAIVVNENLIQLATSAVNAELENFIDLTTNGTPSSVNLYSNLLTGEEYKYYAIVIDSNTIKIAYTYDDAIFNIPIVFQGTTTGTHTLYWNNKGRWRQQGEPKNIALDIIDRFVYNPSDITNKIPGFGVGSIYPEDTIVYPTGSATMDFDITSVYTVVKELCEVYGLGFRITINTESNPTYPILFSIYSGNDRTTTQTSFDPVVFDSRLDNLRSDTEYTSTKNLKNVAYVYSPNGFEIVYSGSASINTSGFDKRILYVKANDISTPTGVVLTNQLTLRGQQELSKNRTLIAFDGEIPQNGSYIYDVDYYLGDIVEMRNVDGFSSIKRVTEHIFADDVQGEKSYPTLSSELVVTPGTWLAWDNTETWADIPDDLDHEWQDVDNSNW